MNYSLEFFPPRTEEGMSKLLDVARALRSNSLQYCSVTYGAGGSTQLGTLNTVKALLTQGFDVAPHLSCIGANKDELIALLSNYQTMGIRKIVALRGDLPSGQGTTGDLRYAIDLVNLIKQEFGDFFSIEVAAYPEKHPQAESLKQDIDYLCAKFNAGATGAITQYFFNVDSFLYLRDTLAAKGYTQSLIPGIMPIYSGTQLLRFSDMCGAEVPRWLRLLLRDLGDDQAAIEELGIRVCNQQLERLQSAGVDAVHFYTMNKASLLLATSIIRAA